MVDNIKSPSNDKMNGTSFQGRLQKVLARIERRCTDNDIRLMGNPTDVLRLSVKKDENGDITMRRVDENCVLPIVMPEMKDVPLRHFSAMRETANGGGIRNAMIPSLYPFGDKQYYDCFIPVSAQIDDDDLLIRIVYDPACPDDPVLMVLQVKEVLANIDFNAVTSIKIRCTFYDEELPVPILDWIRDTIDKRALVRY